MNLNQCKSSCISYLRGLVTHSLMNVCLDHSQATQLCQTDYELLSFLMPGFLGYSIFYHMISFWCAATPPFPSLFLSPHLPFFLSPQPLSSFSSFFFKLKSFFSVSGLQTVGNRVFYWVVYFSSSHKDVLVGN